jgi:bifunctional non-homologous end joining protein LigD
VKEPPAGDQWLHEIKFDGYRIGCLIRNGRVTLVTRNGNDWTSAYPEIAKAAGELGVRAALIDGEVVMLLPDGRSSFQALQNAFSGTASRAALVYYVFDLLRLDGESLEHLPLERRKARLRALLGRRKSGRIRYADHVVGQGQSFFDQACRTGLEGIVSKRRDLPYSAGRHGGWLKTKCALRQEFVIGGFTDPEGMRAGLGALLVGYYDDGRLVFSGKVGTGFSHQGAIDLRRKLDAIEQDVSPFTPPPAGALGRNAHWVKPVLVGEATFTEWTGDGRIRHPAFQGLRLDKQPKEVVRERTAASAPPVSNPPASRHEINDGGRPVVAGVPISHPDRVVYPSPRLTKADVARYYESIRDWIVPHVRGRPLTLVRCPEGLNGDCFFMKHSQVWAPVALRRVRIQEKKKLGEYLIADDIAAVVGLVQMGVLEIHTWNSDFEDVERPNRLVFDLDPGETVAWPAVISAARAVRAALEALDLEAWVKTTGGRGLHVVVPLRPHADWGACLDFSRALSESLERAHPDLYTTEYAKAGRTKKILIDYLRNNRTNTSIAAYSTRARPGAPVSVPLRWDELRATLNAATLTAVTVVSRLNRLPDDPWKGYWSCRQRLTAQRIRAVRTRQGGSLAGSG